MPRYSHTEEFDAAKIPDVQLPASGAVNRDDLRIETATDITHNDHAERLAFNNELVTIVLQESSDPNDEPRVPVCVNGMLAHPKYGNHLPRGIEIQVKRCVAEVLLRSKPISVKTVKGFDPNGNETANIVRSVGSRYPFTLVNPTKKDLDWQRKVRGEM